MAIDANQRRRCERVHHGLLEQLTNRKGYIGSSVALRRRDGKLTDEICIRVSVKEKLPLSALSLEERVPTTLTFQRDTFPTDVQAEGEIKALALTSKMRPCPAGWSIGHKDITAGTLGMYVRRGTASGSYILSNNHVLANSNEASIGDPIYQPGPADGGSIADRIATLSEFVVINFPGSGDKKKPAGSSAFWKVAKGIPNALAKAQGCNNRLVIRQEGRVSQPNPNLVDAAIALVVAEDFADPRVGRELLTVDGIRDLQLGDRVFKWGRTTERTIGIVEQVDLSTQVSYGGIKIAQFENQLGIGSLDGDFSLGGDSGSAILSEDEYLGGLLFAGGDNTTVANPISSVIALLGIRL